MISYAQNFEDVMLARVFRERADGFYVDVGAGDPVELSVTKWFYDQGWSGINVEPNPTFHEKLAAERLRDVNLCCGAGAIEGEALYFQLSANELSSFDPEVRARAEAAGMSVVPRTVAVLPLTTILDRHSNGRRIDFLKIDVEGWEREVLMGLDLQRYRPTVIIVEATLPKTRIESHSQWDELLTRSDYAAVHFDGLSRFYLPSERMDLKVHFQLPPNVFDNIKIWPQAATEIELTRLRADLDRAREVLSELRNASEREINRLQADLKRAQQALAVFHGEAENLRRVLGEPSSAIAESSRLGDGPTHAIVMTDYVGIDAIRKANWTLSSPTLLANHVLKAGMRGLRRRLRRRGG